MKDTYTVVRCDEDHYGLVVEMLESRAVKRKYIY